MSNQGYPNLRTDIEIGRYYRIRCGHWSKIGRIISYEREINHFRVQFKFYQNPSLISDTYSFEPLTENEKIEYL
jgi:hypothetical protein